ncbi:MAG TPA: hypothetical protein VHF25_11505 [Nitriliruptorales bacterium]|nr:hypothetical protein [Nitriliruptorales bacterium]
MPVPTDDRTHPVVVVPLLIAVLALGEDPQTARMALLTAAGTFGPLALARWWARLVVTRRVSPLSELAWLLVPAAAVGWAAFAWSVMDSFPETVQPGVAAGAWASLAMGGLLAAPGPWTPAGRLLMQLLGHAEDVPPAVWMAYVFDRITRGLLIAAPLAALGFGPRAGLAACALAVVAIRARAVAKSLGSERAAGRGTPPRVQRQGS